MIADRPKASAWLDIPDTCHMRGEFTADLDIQVVPIPDDHGVDLPKLHSQPL